ncbi:MAG: ParA family protein [Eubacteriales bacterium]|nr:ParA family protein [Eubacteriales bacterium]
MKKVYVLIGNFGSGKTEISLNLAINGARTGKSTLVDLDVINPYFRSAERKKELTSAGVRLLHPIFAMTGVDVPSLPPDIYSVFIDDSETVVFDVGGDPAGATALGQYKQQFDGLPSGQLQVLYVVNPRRPFSATPELVLEMLDKIQSRSRLSVSGFINNANLSRETTAQDLLAGYELLAAVVGKTGIPVLYTCAEHQPLEEFMQMAKSNHLTDSLIGKPLEIRTLMHRDWDRFTESGI